MAGGQVGVWVAAHIQAVWLRELIGIAICRGQQDSDELALAEMLAAEFKILGDRPVGELDRRVETEELVDRRGEQPRILHQAFALFGVPEQGDHRVAHEVGGGFVAGCEHQSAERKQVVFLELVPLVFDVDHRREQIVSRFRAARGKQRTEVGEEIPGGPAHGLSALTALKGVKDLNEAARPSPKLGMILARYAEQFRDGDEREGVSKVGNEFDGAAGRHVVEQIFRHRLQARAESFDPAGREGLADQATQSPVVLTFAYGPQSSLENPRVPL